MKYNHQKIEKKWQRHWENRHLFEVKERAGAKKFYVLDMFPYPSAEGLHVGHPEGYTATDIIARYMRMKGCNVLHPIGFDAFGLPTENYAIKTGLHPKVATKRNIKRIRRQIKSLGFAYDWSREVNTTDPEYYKWTQWIFLKMWRRGLAYEAKVPINFCPSCKTGLANEEVLEGRCERCKSHVVKKDMRQWMLRITKYADRLLSDLDLLNWPEQIKLMQKNWIGRSDGSRIAFPLIGDFNFVLLHGYRGSSKGIFFPWLCAKLKKEGYECFCPDLPNPSLPKEEEQVNFVLKKAKFNNNTILFGHSLGAIVALKVLEKIQTKIAGLVLAGGFITHRFKDGRRPFEKTFSWKFDFEKIKKNTGFITILSAINDYAVPREQGRLLFEKLNGDLHEVRTQKPHFTGSAEPVIFDHLSPFIKIFTTRADTMFGATYLVLAPEHKLLSNLKSQISNIEEVEGYVKAAKQKSDLERTDLAREKTGVEIKGVKVKNRCTGKEIPIWVADYVLPHYGTGAIMAVPAHDQRDFEFAKKYNLSVIEVVSAKKKNFVAGEEGGFERAALIEKAYEGEGILVNSEKFNGMKSQEAREAITKYVGGEKSVNYKLRDWVFSRQRYWGEPIPLVHCEKCGVVVVPEKNLPVKLPDVKKYRPKGEGESPLAAVTSWVNVKCPKCGGKAKRETNTMPQWAGSCWYYIAYTIKRNSKFEIRNSKLINYWLPVDLYVGGAEHAVLHLLYARFWHKFLYDEGLVNTPEPFIKLKNQGLILGEDGQKMSKSRGNVINPDEVIAQYGADTMRMYEMFMGPFEEVKPWSTRGIIGIRRFLEKVFNLINPKSEIRNQKQIQNSKSKFQSDATGVILSGVEGSHKFNKELNKLLYKTIKKVTEDIENFKFNTAISAMMIFLNELQNFGGEVDRGILEKFLLILSPFAPHISEELWEKLGHRKSIFKESWPEYDRNLIKEDFFELVIQINGKVRDRVRADIGISQDQALALAKKIDKIRKYLSGRKIIKAIYVPRRLLNIVIS